MAHGAAALFSLLMFLSKIHACLHVSGSAPDWLFRACCTMDCVMQAAGYSWHKQVGYILVTVPVSTAQRSAHPHGDQWIFGMQAAYGIQKAPLASVMMLAEACILLQVASSSSTLRA